jgi:thymidylate synthase
MMFAHELNLRPGEFIHTMGDAHLYTNHIDQAHTQLARKPKQLPKVVLTPKVRRVVDFTYEDITLMDYTPHPHIKAEVSV